MAVSADAESGSADLCDDRAWSSLSVMQSVLSMAKRPECRTQLLADTTCLGGLVLLLSNDNAQLVQTSLDVFCQLALTRPGRVQLPTCVGLRQQLADLVRRYAELPQPTVDQLHVRITAQRLSKLLFPAAGQSATADPFKRPAVPSGGAVPGGPLSGGPLPGGPAAGGHRSLSFVCLGMRERFHVDLCRSHLLLVPGVVSMVFDLPRSRVTLRCRASLAPVRIAAAIAHTGCLLPRLVVRDSNSDAERLVEFDEVELAEIWQRYHGDVDERGGGRDATVNMSQMASYLDERTASFSTEGAVRLFDPRLDATVATAGRWLRGAAEYFASNFLW